MNMMDSPKFRRKHRTATGPRTVSDSTPPVPPMDDLAREAARRRELAAEQARAEAQAAEAATREKARRKAELEEMARAEALRRVKAARAQREAEARQAEDAARKAADEARREEERLLAEERAAEALRREQEDQARAEEAERRRAAEAEAARRAEEERVAEDLRKAEEKRVAEREAAEAARREEERRRAERAEAERRAEEERVAEDRRRAEQEEADRRLAARQAAEARAAEALKAATPPLSLTDMVPVTGRPIQPVPETPAEPEPDAPHMARVDSTWAALPELTVDKTHLNRNRIITASREDPAHAAFDVLRTRLLQALHENGWRRVAITSPGKECGKTFTAANLAVSLSRQENCRTLLLDLDMRRPSLHRVLGIEKPGSLGDMLRGLTAPEAHLRRMGRNPVNAGRNIAFGLNDRPEPYASELLQDPRTEECFQAIEDRLAPDVILIDLPPALSYDDVIAARPLYDGVLLVLGGGLTTEREVTEVERRLGGDMPILGMILNKAEGTELDRYTY